jgi:hypothetical protein
MKHTPEQWAVYEALLADVDETQFLIQAHTSAGPDDFDDIIAEIPWVFFDYQTRERHAYMIAAVPTLLAAAEALMDEHLWVYGRELRTRSCRLCRAIATGRDVEHYPKCPIPALASAIALTRPTP